MKDLYRCLAEHPPPLLSALADRWHADLPTVEGLEAITALGDAMLAPERLRPAVEELSPDAREALALLVERGGAVAAHRMAGYGAIRRLGPARLARERPWATPDNPVEELYYRGLVYRAYGSTEAQLGEILLIPDQLLDALRRLPRGVLGAPHPGPDASRRVRRALVAGDALCEDIVAALVALRVGRPRVLATEEPAGGPAASRPPLDLGERLVGPPDPERLALLRRLLWRLGLVRTTASAVQPSLRAREWLQLPELRRAYTALVAWRDDPRWSELHLLEGLSIEGSPPKGRLASARRTLLHLLADPPGKGWIDLEAYLRVIKRRRPDLLREPGELTWSVREAEGERYLEGMETWERVEGALVGHLLRRPLHWLGVVDVGESATGEVVAFRVSERGQHILRTLRDGGELPGPAAAAAPAVVGDDFTVTIPVSGTMYERYQLERFAEWQSQGTEAVYRITPESVWQGHNTQIRMEQIVAFLRRISGDAVPPNVLGALHAWGGRYGRAFLRRTVLLETVDEATMRQIAGAPALRKLLGEQIAPRVRAVAEEDVEALTALLREMGIWPILR